MQIQVQMDPGELEALRLRIVSAMARVFNLTALQLWGDLREETPVAGGYLAGSWELEQAGTFAWRISTVAGYILPVLEGSDPHEIRPSRARALRFQTAGGFVFARRVMHPGTKANPFVDRAIDRTNSRIEDLVDQALEGVG